MTGRADVAEENEIALATTSDGAKLAFNEQINFFRRKLSLTTKAWADIWQSQHDGAFVIASAARDALLSDLRSAVDSAISKGTTLNKFRQDFDGIVARHG